MEKKSFISLKRLLALLLALTLFAVLPAMGEEVEINLDGGAGVGSPETEGIEIEELPELPGALEFSDALELTDDAGLALEDDLELSLPDDSLNGDMGNTSKPVMDPSDYTLRVRDDYKFTMTVRDSLTIITPESRIASWRHTDDSVATIVRDSKSPSRLAVTPRKPGVTKVIMTLGTRKVIRVTLTIEPDPSVLTKLSFKQKKVTLLTGMDIDLKVFMNLEPPYPNWNANFSTSDSEVLPITRDCIIHAMKPGRATITAVANNGLKASMDVVVKANSTKALYPEPTAKSVKKLGPKWTLIPDTLEMNGNGTIACSLWMVNGSDEELTAISNVDLSISMKDKTGDTLIARANLRKAELPCKKNSWTSIVITFPVRTVWCSSLDFTKLDAKDLKFRLNEMPEAAFDGKGGAHPFQAGEILVGDTSADRNNVKYRALLVSESDFYWPEEEKPEERWEHINRNKGDVELMERMLKQVKTPDGGKYAITTKDDTSLNQLRQLIQKTFADADENDVSLFFIASHGDSGDNTPEKDAGMLFMASQGENRPEKLRLSELRDLLLKVPGKVIVILESCGSGAAVVKSNGGSRLEDMARAAEAFDAQAVDVFRSADPGVVEDGYAANTGELRKVNKFYVLTAAAYREESFGGDSTVAGKNGSNLFTDWLVEGVGKSGNMPADEKFAGNQNGKVDLHELYRFISNVGDWYKIHIESKRASYYQHVQVYPSDVRYTLFR
jgi:hypothetical protein